jgi:hypothetical protein
VDESVKDLIAGPVPDRSVHREIFVETEDTIVWKQILRVFRNSTTDRVRAVRRHLVQ